jgi:hypothetical protein
MISPLAVTDAWVLGQHSGSADQVVRLVLSYISTERLCSMVNQMLLLAAPEFSYIITRCLSSGTSLSCWLSLHTAGVGVRHVFNKEAKSRSSWGESDDPAGQCQLWLLYLLGGVQSLFVALLIKLACHIITKGLQSQDHKVYQLIQLASHPSCHSHIMTQEAEPETHVVDQLI